MNFVILKHLCILQHILRNVIFFFTSLFQEIFNTAQYFILTKNLNTACNPTEMKQKLLH